ncbi:MFS transporter [Tistrella bauzanensis]|uniref:MFS transporter n=1 Tax=Tistrella arctica TaxID=3133430 RepID=A0ABU9YFS1_9PROT
MTTVLASVAAVLLSIAIAQLGNGMLSSLVGLRLAAEGVSTIAIGLVGAAHFVGWIIGAATAQRVIVRVGHIRAFSAFAAIGSVAILSLSFFLDLAGWAALRVVTGYCMAALFMTAESWLNSASTNQTRGKVLSAYIISLNLALAGGQFLLTLDDVRSPVLYALAAMALSLALVPLALTRSLTPEIHASRRLGLSALWKVSPLGLAAVIFSGLIIGSIQGGMGAVFANGIGLSTPEISAFIATVFVGGLVLQWPVGLLSDRIDRRRVLAGAAIMVTIGSLVVLAGAAGMTAAEVPRGGGVLAGSGLLAEILSPSAAVWLLFIGAAIVGGAGYALYPVATAHVNDLVEPGRMIAAAGGLVLGGGLGSAIGPILASGIMELIGPSGLFAWGALAGGVLAAFAIYRARVQPKVPASAKSPMVISPRTTPAVAAMATDISGAEAALESDDGMMAGETVPDVSMPDPPVPDEPVPDEPVPDEPVTAGPPPPAPQPAAGDSSPASSSPRRPEQGGSGI